MKKQKSSVQKEVLTKPREDRRILSYVPDPENIRQQRDRRGMKYVDPVGEADAVEIHKRHALSLRYEADFDVRLIKKGKRKEQAIKARAVDISSTGILVRLDHPVSECQPGTTFLTLFSIPPGTMPEGFESDVKIKANVVRTFTKGEEETTYVALEFLQPLTKYLQKKRWGYSIYTASGLLFVAVVLIMLMRVESLLYLRYNLVLYIYSITAAVFLLSRYLFGALYRHVPIHPEYTPGVSIIIPCFNEEQWIRRTILSCMNQDYPLDRLEVIVVDDHSNDRSVAEIKAIVEKLHQEGERYGTKERLRYHVQPKNAGKREALIQGVKMANHDLVVFVDSDSFLDPMAIRHLVQPFQDPQMGGVAGRTDVENKYTNLITKLQTVRYYIAFRIIKAAESYFDAVTCLSGPLSCYRKDLVLKHADDWLNQKFLGQPATFGDDRSLTNFILKTHRTGYQDTAVCSTIVPSSLMSFLKQQMRWKRSWLRESIRASSFMWRKEPFMSLFFYIGLIVPIVAPLIVLHHFLYVPLVHGIFPTMFLFGLLLMSMLISFAHLFFRKSKLWFYGMIFVFFYVFVLLWQMPVAWFTFWKSTWGTRDTPQDIEERKRKEEKSNKRKKKLGLPL